MTAKIICQHTPFILASASPRRRAMLSDIGLDFTCHPADINETPHRSERASDYVSRLAFEKAHHIAQQSPHRWVLGSDTCALCDDEVLGKPRDQDDFMRMMAMLSNNTHQIYTAVSVVQVMPNGDVLQYNCCECAHVTMATIEQDTALAYWQSGEPQDKAGGYAIQGLGAAFVVSSEGSYTGIVGLPLSQTLALLKQAGVVQ